MIRKSTIGLLAAALVITLSACAGGNPFRDNRSSTSEPRSSTYLSPNDSGSASGSTSGAGGRAARPGDDSGAGGGR